MYNQTPFMMMPSNMASLPNTINTVSKTSGLLSKVNWGNMLSNAQKTLNLVNQAIPLYYQVKPMFNNIKTIGKIGKEFSNINNSQNNIKTNNNVNNNIIENTSQNNTQENSIPKPTFFL